jgi:hypothetical protein
VRWNTAYYRIILFFIYCQVKFVFINFKYWDNILKDLTSDIVVMTYFYILTMMTSMICFFCMECWYWMQFCAMCWYLWCDI